MNIDPLHQTKAIIITYICIYIFRKVALGMSPVVKVLSVSAFLYHLPIFCVPSILFLE